MGKDDLTENSIARVAQTDNNKTMKSEMLLTTFHAALKQLCFVGRKQLKILYFFGIMAINK